MSEKLITAENVIKSFGNVKAVKGLDFHLDRDEYVALLGLNGAGKTLFVEMIKDISFT